LALTALYVIANIIRGVISTIQIITDLAKASLQIGSSSSESDKAKEGYEILGSIVPRILVTALKFLGASRRLEQIRA